MRLLVNDVEDLVQRHARSLVVSPAGERLRDAVKKRHPPLSVGGDHGISDAVQGDIKLLALLSFVDFACFGSSPCLVQTFGQEAHERAGDEKKDQSYRPRSIRKLERVWKRDENKPGNQTTEDSG